jgi:hypothetical protein
MNKKHVISQTWTTLVRNNLVELTRQVSQGILNLDLLDEKFIRENKLHDHIPPTPDPN